MIYFKSRRLAGKSGMRLGLSCAAAPDYSLGLQPSRAELRKELGGPKVGGARLRPSLGGLPGNATLKDDFVFWVKALPSRAHGAAAIQGFELDRVYIRSALVRNLTKPHAGPRLGGFPALAYYRFDELGTLLTLKGRSGASPHRSWALGTVSLTQHDYAGSTLGYDL